MYLEGGIFDVDGVILDTPHEKAWREGLDKLMIGAWRQLAPETSYVPGAFTTTVYQEHVAGKPREAGAAAALAYFHIPDPDGTRARQYAATKQEILEGLAAIGDVRVYDDAVEFLMKVKAAGARVCSASSSRNADAFLSSVSAARFAAAHELHYNFIGPRTTLLDLFDADVNGRGVPRGKPDPALFLAAAEALDLSPDRCFVAEDAPAGILAARAAGMFALGVARHDAEALRAAHANIVTSRLDQVDVHALLTNVTSGANA